MSTDATPEPSAPQKAVPNELRLVSHSMMFYWWPVWAVGFIVGLISLIEGNQLAAVPKDSWKGRVAEPATIEELAPSENDPDEDVVKKKEIVEKGRYVVVTPKGTGENMRPPKVTVSQRKSPGIVFCTVLLVVILITNIHLRGLWSLFVIVAIFAIVLLLALFNMWDAILTQLSFLDVRISTGGYMLVSTILLGLWLIIVFVFDPRTYVMFTPGQFRVKEEIGEGERAYDTRGMMVEKIRSDFFRHLIFGIGSGDLIIRTTGAHAHEFQLNNVLFVGAKIRIIEKMISQAGR